MDVLVSRLGSDVSIESVEATGSQGAARAKYRVYSTEAKAAVLALFTVGDVYASLCKKGAYAPFSAKRRSRTLFRL